MSSLHFYNKYFYTTLTSKMCQMKNSFNANINIFIYTVKMTCFDLTFGHHQNTQLKHFGDQLYISMGNFELSKI